MSEMYVLVSGLQMSCSEWLDRDQKAPGNLVSGMVAIEISSTEYRGWKV